ncbi:MAG: hypothetical protein JO179_18810, partial [Solirubrobacterales bacterium]|nr:hypothetical protein [Solirubrobacterales bacterium]
MINDGSGRIQMAATGDYSGQFWALVPRADAKYSLHTAFLGDCFSLDVINDGTNDTPWLAPSGDFSGQLWELTPLDDGTYRLTNDFTGPSKALDTYGDSPNAPFLNTGDFSGQHWTLTPLSQIPSNAPIPALQPPSQGAALTEGPTDYTVCARPVGSIAAAMLFVDFANAPAGTTSASDTADHLLRGSATADDPLRGGAFQDRSFQDLYQQQSDGTVTIQVDVRADLGWRPMPQMSPPMSSAYDFHDFNKQKRYIADAIGLFSDIDLSSYPFVFVVAPQAAGFPDSPAFIAPPGQGVAMPGGGELRLGVTLGKDSYHNRFINLVHEVGHLFGLSDEYPFAGTGDDQVGCWSIMCDIFHSVSFLGWDRHK